MYIPVVVDQIEQHEDSRGPLYSDSFQLTDDILSCKRIIAIYDDELAHKTASIMGQYNIKCTIINKVIQKGNWHNCIHYSNPTHTLIRNVYHGYLSYDIKDIKNKDKYLSDILIGKGTFDLAYAYASAMGIYQTDEHGNVSFYTPYSFSFQDMQNIKNRRRTVHFRDRPIDVVDQELYMRMAGMMPEYNYRFQINFGDDQYNDTLPLPRPEFYTRYHAESFGHKPIIDAPVIEKMSDIIDSNTKINHFKYYNKSIKYKKRNSVVLDYRVYPDEASNHILFFDKEDNIMNTNVRSEDRRISPILSVGNIYSRIDDLFNKVFALYNKYLLNSLCFTYTSKYKKIGIRSMTFGFGKKLVPSSFVNDFSSFMFDCDKIKRTLEDFEQYLGRISFLVDINDLDFNLRLILPNGVELMPDLRYIYYSKSMIDCMDMITDFESSISHPIWYRREIF